MQQTSAKFGLYLPILLSTPISDVTRKENNGVIEMLMFHTTNNNKDADVSLNVNNVNNQFFFLRVETHRKKISRKKIGVSSSRKFFSAYLYISFSFFTLFDLQ